MNLFHKKRNVILAILGVSVGVVIGMRICWLNSVEHRPPVEKYCQEEEVYMEDNVFLDASENMKGYSAIVNKAELLSTKEFIEKYCSDKTDEYEGNLLLEMVVAVEITFKNNSLEEVGEAGINLLHYRIAGEDIYMGLNSKLYGVANSNAANGSLGFMLRPNSEMKFVLPFSFSTDEIPENVVRNRELYLPVCLYPVQKQVRLNIQ